VREVIREFRPASLAIELVFAHRQYPKTSVLMAHARGAILYVARDHELPVMHYTPTQVKRLLTGSGKASKEQMQWAIQREFGLDRLLEPNDVADAAAVALCHYHHPRRTWPPHA
jgi:crossover junction endodeoxyribonuclease RuvC